MADSLTKVGSFPILTIDPNWAEDLSSEFALSRRAINYPGTISLLEAVAPEVPITLGLSFHCETKQEEYELLTFFLARSGRHGRFWMKNPSSDFTLRTAAVAGATGLYCQRNLFDLVYQGFERIYILMADGDLIVRKITACAGGGDYTYIGFDTVLDRDVTLTNHSMIGRFLLGRFNTDKLKFSYESVDVKTTTLQFTELVKEYSLAD